MLPATMRLSCFQLCRQAPGGGSAAQSEGARNGPWGLPVPVGQVFGQTGGEISWDTYGKFQDNDEFLGVF